MAASNVLPNKVFWDEVTK